SGPECTQQPNLAGMKKTDHQMHAGGELGRTQRPALFEHDIVNILKAQARELAKNIEVVQYFLQVDQADFPGPVLLLDDTAQGIGCRAMTASSVEINKIELHAIRLWHAAPRPDTYL